MKREDFQLISSALEEALSLIREEYETLQDEELKERYEEVDEKITKAIRQVKTYA